MVPRVRVAALAWLVTVLVAGCGGSDGGSDLAAADLDGSTYTSTSVQGHDLVAGTTITLAFEKDRMSVQAGCNTMGGGYEVSDGTLRWAGQVSTTLMACSAELTAQDSWLSQLFTDGADAALDGDTLTLTSGDVTIELTAAGGGGASPA